MELLTPNEIADRLDVSLWRVQWVCRTRRGTIRPAKRAGRVRLFDQAGVDAIKHELEHPQKAGKKPAAK